METPKRYAGVSVHNLNSQTPYRTPAGALPATTTAALPRHVGSHSSASSSTRGVTLQRAGAANAATPPMHGWTGSYESPLPSRPTQPHRGGYLTSARLFADETPLLFDNGALDDDEDELFTRYSDFYYDPHTQQSGQAHVPAGAADGGDAHRHTRHGSGRRTCCTCCGAGACVRAALLTVNVLLLLAAAPALLVGLVARQSLEDSLKNLCHDCTRLYHVYMGYTCVLVGAALVGCVMLLGRRRRAADACVLRCGEVCTWHLNACCRVLYTTTLACVLLVLCGWLLAYVLVLRGDIDLAEAWDSSIAAHRTDMCVVEYRLECSGWGEVCPPVNPPLNTTAAATGLGQRDLYHGVAFTDPAALQRTLCPLNCAAYMQAAIDTFTRPCAGVVKHHIRSKAYVLLVPSAVMAAVVLLSLATTCATTRCAPLDGDDDYPTESVARRYTNVSPLPRMTVSVVEN